LHPVFSSGVDTFLYAWTTMSTFAHWSIARDLVDKLLAMLKPVERLVIDMLYLQARSVAEVQKLPGWSAATIKIRAFRARQKLRKQIGGLL
jgi:DNA-directed RNA polymerase specialized sigma24 family protein